MGSDGSHVVSNGNVSRPLGAASARVSVYLRNRRHDVDDGLGRKAVPRARWQTGLALRLAFRRRVGSLSTHRCGQDRAA